MGVSVWADLKLVINNGLSYKDRYSVIARRALLDVAISSPSLRGGYARRGNL